MTVEEILKYFGSSSKFNKLTGMSSASIVNWKRKGFVHSQSQIFLEDFTDGELKASIEQEKEVFKNSNEMALKFGKIGKLKTKLESCEMRQLRQLQRLEKIKNKTKGENNENNGVE